MPSTGDSLTTAHMPLLPAVDLEACGAFHEWLRRLPTRHKATFVALTLVGLAGVVLGVAEILLRKTTLSLGELPSLVAYSLSISLACQAIAIIGIQILFPPSGHSAVPLPRASQVVPVAIAGHLRAHRVARRFQRAWQLAWLSWGLLYAVLAAIVFICLLEANDPVRMATLAAKDTTIKEARNLEADSVDALNRCRGKKPDSCTTLAAEVVRARARVPEAVVGRTMGKLSPIIDLLNNATSILLIVMFLLLSVPTKLSSDEPGMNLQSGFFIGACCGILAFLSVGKALINLSEDLAPMGQCLTLIGGVAAGCATALLSGRLESKLIDAPLWTVAALYCYGAIQACWVFFPDDLAVMLALTSLALAFKMLLFLVIWWLSSGGVLCFYLHEVNAIDQDTPSRRRDFLSGVFQADGSSRE